MTARFTSPPDPGAFNALVWAIVREIPAGKVATYGQIAAMIGSPAGMPSRDSEAHAPRWVGGAMAACPDDVPWQRVVNSRGGISLRPGLGPRLQRKLLEKEGVRFDDKGRADLDIYGWEGPPDEWLRQRNLRRPPSPAKPFSELFKI